MELNYFCLAYNLWHPRMPQYKVNVLGIYNFALSIKYWNSPLALKYHVVYFAQNFRITYHAKEVAHKSGFSINYFWNFSSQKHRIKVKKSQKSLNLIFVQVKQTQYVLLTEHSVLERIWVKGSNLSQWLPQGERGPPKESKSLWIEILHIGSQFT